MRRNLLFKPFAATARDLRPLGGFDNIAIARLAPGVSIPAALAELNSVQARLARAAPEPAEFYATLVPMARQIVARSRTGVQLAFITAALVLLVTCVNISGLMLTRAERRRREFAIRSAAGATRGRLVLQALIESLVVSSLAGIVAIAAGAALIRLVGAAAPVDLPRIAEVSLSAGVVLFAAAVTAATGLLIGLIPALHTTRTDALLLRAGPAAPPSAKATARLRSVLIGLEVAASAACLVFGAVLLVSYVKLMTVDRGSRLHGRARRRLWPGQNPIGKRFRFGADDSQWVEVVGVVNDVRAVDLSRDPPLGIYLPIDNFYGRAALVARAETDPAALAVALRRDRARARSYAGSPHTASTG